MSEQHRDTPSSAEEERGPLSENVTLDNQNDIVTAYGVKISGELLRHLGEPTPEGHWFRIVSVKDGVATVQQRTDLVPSSESTAMTPIEREHLIQWHEGCATWAAQADDYGGERMHNARAAELRRVK